MVLNLFSNNSEVNIISVISNLIEQYISKFESSVIISSVIDILAESTDLKKNKYLFLVGSKFKNHDIFLKLLCNKIIYLAFYSNNVIDIINKYEYIDMYFNKKELYQYNSICNDLITNNKYNNIIIGSLSHWSSINYKLGHTSIIEDAGQFSKTLLNSLDEYKINNNNYNKFLILYPHLGFVDITITYNNNTCNILMLPAHMLCLETFDKYIDISKDELYKMLSNSLTSYDSNFINSIIKSLIIGEILIDNVQNSKNILTLNSNLPNMIDLCKIFNIINTTSTSVIDIITEELVYSRNDILMCQINSFIKKNELNKIEHNILFNLLINSIDHFLVTPDNFNKAIKTMIEKDYITQSIENDIVIYSKLLY